jgi:hypothetical protein
VLPKQPQISPLRFAPVEMTKGSGGGVPWQLLPDQYRRSLHYAASAEMTYAAEWIGGADRDRTGDPLLAKQVLSQLSYSPLTLNGGPG